MATGLLHGPGIQPEKTIRALDADAIAASFAVNAIGPALILRHFLPLMPRDRRAVFAVLSAKARSIGDTDPADPLVASVNDALHGNWVAFNTASDVTLPFLRYPQG